MEKLVLGRLQVSLKSSGILQTLDLFHYSWTPTNVYGMAGFWVSGFGFMF
jgi:hypothetical protein